MNPNLNTRGANYPLFMLFTNPSVMEEGEIEKAIYDPFTQTTTYDARTMKTKCLKSHATKKMAGSGTKSDLKNELDDAKNV